MAVGPGLLDEDGKRIKMDIKEDMVVMYKKWGGNEVKVNGEEWLLVEQKDILLSSSRRMVNGFGLRGFFWLSV